MVTYSSLSIQFALKEETNYHSNSVGLTIKFVNNNKPLSLSLSMQVVIMN